MKKQRFGSYAYVLVGILAVISLVLYVLNASTAYYKDLNASIVVMTVVAIAAVAGTLVCANLLPGKAGTVASDVCRVAVSALIIAAGVAFLAARVESFGYIFGSNLELGNQAAFDAGSQAIYGIIFFVATWIVSLVACFLSVGKKRA